LVWKSDNGLKSIKAYGFWVWYYKNNKNLFYRLFISGSSFIYNVIVYK